MRPLLKIIYAFGDLFSGGPPFGGPYSRKVNIFKLGKWLSNRNVLRYVQILGWWILAADVTRVAKRMTFL